MGTLIIQGSSFLKRWCCVKVAGITDSSPECASSEGAGDAAVIVPSSNKCGWYGLRDNPRS